MSDNRRGLTRRRFLAAAPSAALAADVFAGPGESPRQAPPAAIDPARPGLAIDRLGLDAATRADLEAFAQPVLRETRWLDDLPIDEVTPAFFFHPDEGWE